MRLSFARVEARPIVAALIFYRGLFERDPELRRMFHTDIEEQAVKLMEMLGRSISLLDQPGILTGVLESLGARHVGYGVRENHYATVGAALLDMLDEVLGDNFTPPVREAWATLYAVVSETMRRGARRAAAPNSEPAAA